MKPKKYEIVNYIAMGDKTIFVSIEDFCGSSWEELQKELLDDLIKANLVVKE